MALPALLACVLVPHADRVQKLRFHKAFVAYVATTWIFKIKLIITCHYKRRWCFHAFSQPFLNLKDPFQKLFHCVLLPISARPVFHNRLAFAVGSHDCVSEPRGFMFVRAACSFAPVLKDVLDQSLEISIDDEGCFHLFVEILEFQYVFTFFRHFNLCWPPVNTVAVFGVLSKDICPRESSQTHCAEVFFTPQSRPQSSPLLRMTEGEKSSEEPWHRYSSDWFLYRTIKTQIIASFWLAEGWRELG